ncbi:MAG: KpsF/GutQ family sugar-phosphate isomerase [Elusimicrobia bacterium]|nr:KpsF/GutQ family sugar-phosphate isomerase [Elusimicrobiota bacterium]
MNPPSAKAILHRAQEVLAIEARAIAEQQHALGRPFVRAVEWIAQCPGRVVVMGIGKSGLVGRKIAATLTSTGTPSVFVHPSEVSHGDLGTVSPHDVVLALSFSGETEELRKLLPFIRERQLKLIVLTGRRRSRLARSADLILSVRIRKEACPYNLTPTASTTAMLALGDALAMAVMERKGFRAADFAKLHPGGMLGKRLQMRVKEIMRRGRGNPVVTEEQSVQEALLVMTKTRLGATNVVNRRGRLVGFFTDGDLRRRLQRNGLKLECQIREVMTPSPVTIHPDQLASEAAEMLKRFRCDNLPVVDRLGRPVGVVDERDLLAEGLG